MRNTNRKQSIHRRYRRERRRDNALAVHVDRARRHRRQLSANTGVSQPLAFLTRVQGQTGGVFYLRLILRRLLLDLRHLIVTEQVTIQRTTTKKRDVDVRRTSLRCSDGASISMPRMMSRISLCVDTQRKRVKIITTPSRRQFEHIESKNLRQRLHVDVVLLAVIAKNDVLNKTTQKHQIQKRRNDDETKRTLSWFSTPIHSSSVSVGQM